VWLRLQPSPQGLREALASPATDLAARLTEDPNVAGQRFAAGFTMAPSA